MAVTGLLSPGRVFTLMQSEQRMPYRLGILTSHPIQYQAPLFRELAQQLELNVFFAHRQTAEEQSRAGFNVDFEWDVDLLAGYGHKFLRNKAKQPDVSRFSGCDTPDIVDEICQGGFDAFLVTGWYLKSYWQAIRACRKYGVPVMVRGDSQLGSPRGWLKQWLKEIIYPRLLRQFDACLYVGQRNKEYVEHYGVPPQKLFFSPHCIDNDWFSSLSNNVNCHKFTGSLGISSNTKIVLFAGKLLERKRPLDMIKALQVLLDRGVNVCGVFVGDGHLNSMLKEYGKKYEVPLYFLGFHNQSELPEVYTCAECLVLPSEASETWGLVVNEALACGTPVVVSDAVGCVPDLVDAGDTGEIYPVGDVEGLADALQSVLTNRQAYRGMKEKINTYSVEAAASGIVAALKSYKQ